MRIRFSRAGECVVHRRVLPGQPDELPDVVCLAHRVEPGVAAVRPDQPGEDAHCCRLADAVGIQPDVAWAISLGGAGDCRPSPLPSARQPGGPAFMDQVW